MIDTVTIENRKFYPVITPLFEGVMVDISNEVMVDQITAGDLSMFALMTKVTGTALDTWKFDFDGVFNGENVRFYGGIVTINWVEERVAITCDKYVKL